MKNNYTKVQNSQYQQAIDLLKNKRYKASSDILESLLNHSQPSVKILSSFAFVLQQLEKKEKAKRYYKKALNVDSRHILSLQNYSILLREEGSYIKAEALLKKALSLNSQIPEIYQNLGSNQAGSGKIKQAFFNFSKAISLDPLNPSHHHWLNLMLWSEGDSRFLESYYSVLERYPNAFTIKRELVYKLILSDKLHKAEILLKELIDKDSRAPLNFKLAGIIYRKLRNFEEAIKFHSRALQLDANNISLKEELATSYFCAGLPEKSLIIINEILKEKKFHQGAFALKSLVLRVLESDEYYYLCDYDSLVLFDKIDVPKGYKDLGRFNSALSIDLEKLHISQKQPLEQSLSGGTQSSGNLFSIENKIFQILKHLFDETTRRFISKFPKSTNHPVYSRNTGHIFDDGAWSVKLRSSGFHHSHFHSHGWLSGPYYVQLPSEVSNSTNKEGWIKFGEPGIENIYNLKADHFIRPKEGHLVRFPSYFWHGTIPFSSVQNRLVVTQDIRPS